MGIHPKITGFQAPRDRRSLTTTVRSERRSAALPKTTEGRPNKHFTHASIYPLKDRRDRELRGECLPASSTRRPRQGSLANTSRGEGRKETLKRSLGQEEEKREKREREERRTGGKRKRYAVQRMIKERQMRG
ncbi:hypothetical protein E2C01_048062 [Portunus trituberculatus]|uniref:Uncharacterized protein n=1 Tax=Portunus trituberculatus TaxID=210409 RepID=A0A5B7GC79_PORTR|nr:hypothetical protein [Portunus trituberculatus]